MLKFSYNCKTKLKRQRWSELYSIYRKYMYVKIKERLKEVFKITL